MSGTTDYLTVDEIAARLGVSPKRAANIMSERGIRSVRVYPADTVDQIHLPGQGSRTDLRTRILAFWWPTAQEYNRRADAAGLAVEQDSASLLNVKFPMWEPTGDDADELLAKHGWRRVGPWRDRTAVVERIT